MKKAALIISIIFSAYTFAEKVTFNLATYNIRNFSLANVKGEGKRHIFKTNLQELKKNIAQTNADLISVQEIRDPSGLKLFIKENFPQYTTVLSECGGRSKQRVGFIFNHNTLNLINFAESQEVNPENSCFGGVRPVAIGKFYHKKLNLPFVAMTVHLKAGGRKKQTTLRHRQIGILSKIIQRLYSQNERNLVIMGDFNTTNYLLRNNFYQNFIRFVERNNLVDFAEGVNCSSYWWGGVNDGVQYPSLLDHIIISKSFFNNFLEYNVTPLAHCQKKLCQHSLESELGIHFKEVSDHCPIKTSLTTY